MIDKSADALDGSSGSGRFAPGPTGALHLGNLRTALVAWLFARHAEIRFILRIDDVDRVASRTEIEARQIADLRALGVSWDGPIRHQSTRTEAYRAALDGLNALGVTYPCFCTRREIREASSAPHEPRIYPGTCRNLTSAQRSERSRGRATAIRFRADPDELITFDDEIAGQREGVADDVVLWRNDGYAAYNLATVVDDIDGGITQVVRGDDLLHVTPTQIALIRALGGREPAFAHVPLVVAPTGDRLAKRDGAVSLTDLARVGIDAGAVVAWIGSSLGLCGPGDTPTSSDLLQRFDPTVIEWTTWQPAIPPLPADDGGP